jgi:hypothetical protein
MTPIEPAHPEEEIPAGEADDIAVISRISTAVLDRDARPVRRGQHPKHHGCVRAEFRVDPNIPAELKVGIFREPRAYPAWIRFSNGAQDDDGAGDIHGMAIKLMGVGGPKILDDERDEETQDFVLMDHPAFFARNTRSNRSLAEVIECSAGPSLLRQLTFWARTERQIRTLYIAVHHFILGLRFHELAVLRTAVSKMPPSPLEIRYWSATPYALCERVVKYSTQPHNRPPGVAEPTDLISPDRLRAAMTAHLDRAEARFDFLVQMRAPAGNRAMPVEDASVEWLEYTAPFRKVATIIIPPQTFDTPARMAFCENLSYTPWHSLPEHRPLGGINRARRVVYQELSKIRHASNAVPRREPHADFMPEGSAPYTKLFQTQAAAPAPESTLPSPSRSAPEGEPNAV